MPSDANGEGGFPRWPMRREPQIDHGSWRQLRYWKYRILARIHDRIAGQRLPVKCQHHIPRDSWAMVGDLQIAPIRARREVRTKRCLLGCGVAGALEVHDRGGVLRLLPAV